MTLSTESSRVSYSGNGATTNFAFSFKIWAASNLKVYLRDTTTLADTLQTLTTHYSIDIVTYPNTGNVVFVVPPPAGKTIVIVRDMPLTQELDLIASGAFAAENVEVQLDKIAGEIQTLADRVARSLLLPIGTALSLLALPEPSAAVANRYLAVNSSGDGYALIATTPSAPLQLRTVFDFGAIGGGVTNDIAAFTAAQASAGTIFVPKSTYELTTALPANAIAAWLIDPQADVNDWTKFNTIRGGFKNISTTWPSGSNIWRFPDRAFFGTATYSDGSSTESAESTYVADDLGVNSHYLERSATVLSTSPWGGIGGTFGTKASLRYSYLGYSAWATGVVVGAGAKRGYGGRLYTTAAGGVTGITAPTHTVGSVSDGGVTWTFVDFSYQTPIGVAAFCDNDVFDGSGVWATYVEMVRRVGAGTGYAREIAVKNKGSNVVSNPYAVAPGGASLGDWFAGGGDATLGAPANPSTAAISIGKNATTWNKGLVFAADGITGTDGVAGTGSAIALAKGHVIEWYSAGGSLAASLYSDVDTPAQAPQIKMVNDGVQFLARSAVIGTIENGSGGASVNYARLVSKATGTAPDIRPNGDANVDMELRGRGTGGGRLADGAGTVRVAVNTTGIGFFATAPVAKQAPSGSRGGNAALASLLTALAATGLLTDSTSA